MAEYKTGVQVNYGFGLSFEASGKAPVIAKRIWETLADAQAYVDSATDTAIAGLQLTVINDTDASKNGVYFVKEAAGENGKTVGVLVKLAQGADTSGLQTQVTANKQAIDKLNGTTDETSVTKKIKDAIGALDVTNNTSDAVNGIKVTVNQADGFVQKPVIEITPGSVKKDDTGLVTGAAVRTAIDAAVGTTYKVRGCVENYADLPTEDRNVGDVWNIQNAFTLPDDNKPYPAGTNVVWVGAHSDGEGTAHAAHWDALGGTVDLSGYAQKTDFDKLKAALVDSASINGNDIVTEGQDGNITGNAIILDSSDIKIQNNYNKYATLEDVKKGEEIGSAIAKLEYKADKALDDAAAAATAGVTSVGKQKGDIAVGSAASNGVTIGLTVGTDKTLKPTITGLGTAAKHAEGDFATKEQGDKADNSVQYNAQGDAEVKEGTADGGGNIIVPDKIISKRGVLQLGADAQTSFDITIQSTATGEAGDVPAINFSVGSDDVILTGVATPSDMHDAANKVYVDTKVSAVDTGVISISGTKGNITLDSAKTYGNIALSIANNPTTGENYITANLSWAEI